MKRSLGLLVILVVALGACGVEEARPVVNPTPSTLPALETWCASVSADRCVEGLIYLDWNPDRSECVFEAADPRQSFWDLCADPEPATIPSTTVPDPDAGPPAEDREQLERRLGEQDRRAAEVLSAAHPDDRVTVGLVLADPLATSRAEQLVTDAGGTPIAAWRIDFVCLPGWEDMPFPSASRFAYFDGVERAERMRLEMENSTTPVTGFHIPMNAFAHMEQEARALREPGVLLEALQAEVPVASIAALAEDPAVARVRLADFPNETLDLSEAPIPDCPTS